MNERVEREGDVVIDALRIVMGEALRWLGGVAANVRERGCRCCLCCCESRSVKGVTVVRRWYYREVEWGVAFGTSCGTQGGSCNGERHLVALHLVVVDATALFPLQCGRSRRRECDCEGSV